MLPRGRIKATPEDFVVDEMALYEPSGEGEHLYVRFTKRGLNTDFAARQIGSALGVNMRDVGIAGMKDRHAVTSQSISLPIPRGDAGANIEARAMALAIDGVTIHEAKRHGNKLRTGHLAGNRFAIVVREIPRDKVGEVVATLERIGREGLPNAFGSQRFGRDRDNAERARAWLSGRSAAPRDFRLKKLLWSALQSELFNEVLRRRVEDGTWTTPLEGDLVKRRASGGLFLCADVQVDQARALEGEVSPTGPIFGVKMRSPEGKPGELEQAVLAEKLGDSIDFAATKPFGEGARRALRLWVEELRVEVPSAQEDAQEVAGAREQGVNIRVYFVLPKGAYATTVLSAAVALDETVGGTAASSAEQPETGESVGEAAETE